MKITKGTIIRTLVLSVVVINIILKAIGKPILAIEEGTVAYFVETIVEIAVIAASWWYNNSFTQNAKRADEFMKILNEENEEGYNGL